MKVRSVKLRRNRKKPMIVFRLMDGSEKSFTVDADIKTAEQVFEELS